MGKSFRTDCVTIFLNVVARGGTVRWNRYITPDLCLATSWLHDLIYTLNIISSINNIVWENIRKDDTIYDQL
jgi:hypothetical protein